MNFIFILGGKRVGVGPCRGWLGPCREGHGKAVRKGAKKKRQIFLKKRKRRHAHLFPDVFVKFFECFIFIFCPMGICNCSSWPCFSLIEMHFMPFKQYTCYPPVAWNTHIHTAESLKKLVFWATRHHKSCTVFYSAIIPTLLAITIACLWNTVVWERRTVISINYYTQSSRLHPSSFLGQAEKKKKNKRVKETIETNVVFLWIGQFRETFIFLCVIYKVFFDFLFPQMTETLAFEMFKFATMKTVFLPDTIVWYFSGKYKHSRFLIWERRASQHEHFAFLGNVLQIWMSFALDTTIFHGDWLCGRGRFYFLALVFTMLAKTLCSLSIFVHCL